MLLDPMAAVRQAWLATEQSATFPDFRILDLVFVDKEALRGRWLTKVVLIVLVGVHRTQWLVEATGRKT